MGFLFFLKSERQKIIEEFIDGLKEYGVSFTREKSVIKSASKTDGNWHDIVYAFAIKGNMEGVTLVAEKQPKEEAVISFLQKEGFSLDKARIVFANIKPSSNESKLTGIPS